MFTILEELNNKLVVNRSRFLGFAFYCNTEKNRNNILKKLKSDYPSANHYCFAHVFWDKSQIVSLSSDDREPSNTAGNQILNVLKANNFINVLCVVVRFFGGVKLGTQNLSKAYKDCASITIDKALIKQVDLRTKCMIKCDYNSYNKFSKIFPNLKHNPQFEDDIIIEAMLTEEQILKIKNLGLELTETNEKFFC